MTAPGPQQPYLDRVVFMYGQADIELTGSSLSPNGERTWEPRLLEHVRVSHDERPSESFWYWYDEASAVLLRRVRGVGGNNRSDWCHGLVAARSVLTPRHALALYAWPGWEEPENWYGRELDPVAAEVVNAGYSHTAAALTATAAEHRAELVTLAAAAVRDPRAPLAVLTDRLQLHTVVALLWGLLECTYLPFDTSAGEPLPNWTFSTFEVRHDAQMTKRPHVAFLSSEIRLPHGAELVGTPVRLSHAGPDDVATAKADELVSAYVQGGYLAVERWLDAQEVRDLPTVEAQCAALLSLPEPVPESVAPGPAAERTTHGTRLPPPSDSPLADRSDLDLVRKLLGRRVDREVLIAILAEVSSRQVARDNRPELRRLLLRHNFAISPLRAHLKPAPVRGKLHELVRFAVQPADFDDPWTVTALNNWLGDPNSPPSAVNALLHYAEDIGRAHFLAAGAGRRYFYENGVEATEAPEPGAGNSGRSLGLRATIWQWYITQPRLARIGVAMLVAGNVVLFALLLWVLFQ